MTQTRLPNLDVIRGVAILLVCVVNVPEGMGSTLLTHLGNVRLSGWSDADAATWWVLNTFVQGTQRGTLQLLLGASILLLTRSAHAASRSSGAVLLSRYISLALFGVVDIMLIGWFGDILLSYALAALIAAPFRSWGARFLILIGAAYMAWTLVSELRPSQHAPVQPAVVASGATGPTDRSATEAANTLSVVLSV